jgi:hypothetical protein
MMRPCDASTLASCGKVPQDKDHANDGRKKQAPCPPGRNAAIKLNHEAVILLKSGCEEDKAMEILKLGLTVVKSDLAGAAPSQSLPKCQDDHLADSQEVQQRPPTNLLSPSCHCDKEERLARLVPIQVFHTKPLNEDEEFYLYRNAFIFDLSNIDETRCSPLSSMFDTEILSATIIYNLALALTTKAMRTNSSSLLRRSIRLYEMSMGLLNNMVIGSRSNHVKERSFPCDVAWNVAIACSNNLGQLAYLQGDYDQSQTMRSTLQYLLSKPLYACHESRLRSNRLLFTEADLRGFKSNIMFMSPPSLAPMA